MASGFGGGPTKAPESFYFSAPHPHTDLELFLNHGYEVTVANESHSTIVVCVAELICSRESAGKTAEQIVDEYGIVEARDPRVWTRLQIWPESMPGSGNLNALLLSSQRHGD